MSENLLPAPLNSTRIRSYINFDGGDHNYLEDSAQSQLQSEGVAALWHLLGNKGYAYLGDEVGMGKTRQAMGVIATQFLSDPNSHVVIVCPGITLQVQWVREWEAFVRSCYKARDNRLTSVLDGSALQMLDLHERLRDFAQSLLLNENRIHLLRYSSFSRPIWFGNAEEKKSEIDKVKDVIKEYKRCLREIGIPKPSLEEEQIFAQFTSHQEDEWRQVMTTVLNEAYAIRVGQLLQARDIDLVVFDEAQYLRNIGNRQNVNIRHVFRTHVKKWLFMSATPLHTGINDIISLDNYLCIHSAGHDAAKKCPACEHVRCTRALQSMNGKVDVVEILKAFLVRRNRSYQDANKAMYGKVAYRKYERVKVSASKDPFSAMTMALVQKRLVEALSGKNNKFRQGECSSFESLSTSVKNSRNDRDGIRHDDKELEQAGGSDIQDETPDRSSIDSLNRSFRTAMLDVDDEINAPGSAKFNMPHAKLNETATRIFKQNLRNGSNKKSLVFVRRLDTVDELLALMLAQFQDEVDRRLELWRDFLVNKPDSISLREGIWRQSGFWNWSRDQEDSLEDDDFDSEENAISGTEQGVAGLDRAGKLAYFEALKRFKDKTIDNGMLTSFQSRLLVTQKISSNPLRGFLLTRPDFDPQKSERDAKQMDEIWDNSDKCWDRFLGLIIGRDHISIEGEDSLYNWLFEDLADRNDQYWKRATLKRCIFQSFRQSDFLVDLYVLNRFVKQIDSSKEDSSLQEKLLWFLGENRNEQLPEDLEVYVANWKEKIRYWIDYFDLIVDKCLRGEDTKNWMSIYDRVDSAFARMAPVFGRSGRLQDGNAVTQFKFPTHPNILVCTDVLKEGVDLHLFCDEVIHYGVAWTSGDLEQRIGRVDRFGSKISRRISKHVTTAYLPSIIPRLLVEFPYLDGTLDKYQVERVITEKIKSDLRMDLGKRSDELGFITIENLESDNSASILATTQASEGVIFYPVDVPKEEGINTTPQGGNISADCLARPTYLDHMTDHSLAGDTIAHVASIKSLVIRKRQLCSPLSDGSLLCRKKDGKKIVVEEEYLFPTEAKYVSKQEAREKDLSLAAMLLRGGPSGVTYLPTTSGFSFSSKWNTYIANVNIESPFKDEDTRNQVVLIEQIEGFWLMRTPLFQTDRVNSDEGIGSEQWIADQNKKRKWGYMAKCHGIIWFLAFVKDFDGIKNSIYLTDLAERVGKIGDRLQHLFIASDDPENWDYRSTIKFPSLAIGRCQVSCRLCPDC
jgi:superfamily II DNA or RNA helicase